MVAIASLCTLLMLASASPAFAQAPGGLFGTVTAQGEAMPGVTITATNAQGASRSVISGADGNYALPGLPPGPYDMTFSLSGFVSQTRTVRVTSGQTSNQNADLKLEDVSETIIVTAGIEIIDARNIGVESDTATRVDSLFGVENLPIDIINTANLKADSTISERATFGAVGVDVLVGKWKADRAKLRTGARFWWGLDEVTIERDTGTTTSYSGDVYTAVLTSNLIVELQNKWQNETRFRFGQTRGDVDRSPATTAQNGAVTEEHRIRVTRVEFGSGIRYTAGRTIYSFGADYLKYYYSLEHDLDIVFSTPPGASSKITGETKLNKSAVRATAGLTYSVTDALEATASGSFGTDTWGLAARVSWMVR